MEIVQLENGDYEIDGVKFTEEQMTTMRRYGEFKRCKELLSADIRASYVVPQIAEAVLANEPLMTEMVNAYLKAPLNPLTEKTVNLYAYIDKQYGFGEKVQQYLNDRFESLDRLLYAYYLKYFDYTLEAYPTYEKWSKDLSPFSNPNSERVMIEGYANVFAKRYLAEHITEQDFVTEIKDKLGDKACYWDAERNDKFHEKTAERIKDAELRQDWEATLNKYTPKNVTKLSGEIGYGFSDEDIKQLAMLHKKGSKLMKQKIENLLEDCNFHYECGCFERNEYDDWIKPKEKQVERE